MTFTKPLLLKTICLAFHRAVVKNVELVLRSVTVNPTEEEVQIIRRLEYSRFCCTLVGETPCYFFDQVSQGLSFALIALLQL